MKYKNPKPFKVFIKDENGILMAEINFTSIQKINHSPINDLIGDSVNETLIVKRSSFKIEEYDNKC
jgi:hypothetical protein